MSKKILLTIMCLLTLPSLNALADTEKDVPDNNDNIIFSEIQKRQDAYELTIYASTNAAVNAAQIRLTFRADGLKDLEIVPDDSLCELVIEDYLDPETGIYNLACGKPTPGISGEFVLAKMRFDVRKAGFYPFYFLDNLLLANDGYGTDILGHSYGTCLYIPPSGKN